MVEKWENPNLQMDDGTRGTPIFLGNHHMGSVWCWWIGSKHESLSSTISIVIYSLVFSIWRFSKSWAYAFVAGWFSSWKIWKIPWRITEGSTILGNTQMGSFCWFCAFLFFQCDYFKLDMFWIQDAICFIGLCSTCSATDIAMVALVVLYSTV